MGMPKPRRCQARMATPVDPELADKISKTISETISELGRLPLEVAYQVFDNSWFLLESQVVV